MAGSHDENRPDRGDRMGEGESQSLLSNLREVGLVLSIARQIEDAVSKEAKRQSLGDCGVVAHWSERIRRRDGHRLVTVRFNVEFDFDEYLDQGGN